MRKVVRRPRTRKLYDPQSHQYVTQREVLAMVEEGEEVQVVEERSGRDLTAQTLALGLARREEETPSKEVREALEALARDLGRRARANASLSNGSPANGSQVGS